MKTRYIAISAACLMSALTFNSCVELDLNPLSEGSSANWYSSKAEIEMSLNDLYRTAFFPIDDMLWGDDFARRDMTTQVTNGGLTAENGTIANQWENYYKGIARSIRVIDNMSKAAELGISEADVKQYEGEAYCYMGYAYGMIAFHWGQGILNKTGLSLVEAYNATLSPKSEILAFAYECLDKAAANLPASYGGVQRFTKGTALAFKARVALYNGDFAAAAKAAEDCMNLGVYKLYPNYEKLFTEKMTEESIFSFCGDKGLKQYYWGASDPNNVLPRNHGGWGTFGASYELVCAYTCIDGLPIDKSPLYNPKNLFENRDPRLAMTIIPFATKEVLDSGNYNPEDYAFLGIEYTPNPYAREVMNFATGKKITNNDSKAKAEHACYNGFPFKKFVDKTWRKNEDLTATGTENSDKTYPFLRYAEVLLTLAEAKIELGTITDADLDKTINAIRDRAYAGTGIAAPHVKASLGKDALRTVLRTERFVELAWEGHRYEDLIRWKLAEQVFNTPTYYLARAWAGANWDGQKSSANAAYQKLLENWDNGCYPIGGVPKIDANGIADLKPMVDAGYIVVAAQRKFDASRDYLWPIPAGDILVNPNLGQNPNW